MDYEGIDNTKDYQHFLDWLYYKAKPEPTEIYVPRIKIMAVSGNGPSASLEYQSALKLLYSLAYTLKMGLKHCAIMWSRVYFDYKVGDLETQWWSSDGDINISEPESLRWKALLILPPFISRKQFNEARKMASAKHPDLDYSRVHFEKLREERSVQALHIGPYDHEQSTLDRIMTYIKGHDLKTRGRHHEIYLNNPNWIKPEKLKTVIRMPVRQSYLKTVAEALNSEYTQLAR